MVSESELKNAFEKSNTWKHIRYKKLAKIKVCQQCGEKNRLDIVSLNGNNNTDERYIVVLCADCKKKVENAIEKAGK